MKLSMALLSISIWTTIVAKQPGLQPSSPSTRQKPLSPSLEPFGESQTTDKSPRRTRDIPSVSENKPKLEPRPTESTPPVSPVSTSIVRDPVPMAQALMPITSTPAPTVVAKSEAESLRPTVIEPWKPSLWADPTQFIPLVHPTPRPIRPTPKPTRKTPVPVIRPSKIVIGLTQIPNQEHEKKLPTVPIQD
jgi:hypothetical protein